MGAAKMNAWNNILQKERNVEPMKKTISVLLAVALLVVCLVLPITAADHPFTDVSDNAWYADNVQFVYEKGLMAGTAADKFSPETKMNRAMLVTVLYRMDGSHAASGTTPFTDIQTKEYYYPALVWAYGNGIINGTAPDKFSPEAPITREMMVTIFYRYAQFKGLDVSKTDSLSKYADAGKISTYAKTPFAWAVAAGVIYGNSATTLNPLGTATRAECAAILQRFYGLTQSSNDPTEPTNPTEPTEPTDPTETDPTEPDPTEPTEPVNPTEPEPTECNHEWAHYEAVYETRCWIVCQCGWTCYGYDLAEGGRYAGMSYIDAWRLHQSNFSIDDQLDYHASYKNRHETTLVEPEKWVCVRCGLEVESDPCPDNPEEPTEHCHSWQCYHEEEVGYWVPAIQCSCGAVFKDSVNLDPNYVLDLWQEHVSSFSGRDKLDHDGHRDVSYYVVEGQAYDYWVCVIPNCPYDGKHFVGSHP